MDDNTTLTPAPIAVAPQTPPQPEIKAEAPPAVVEDLVDYDHFSKLKLRVALIEAAEIVPKSKKLVKLQIDLGPLGKRQILAGIQQFYTPENLVGKKIIVVANLKPAKLMGLESQGMLLAASSADNSQLVLLQPGGEIPTGSAVS
jgi:methionyl-tRNA synthetase